MIGEPGGGRAGAGDEQGTSAAPGYRPANAASRSVTTSTGPARPARRQASSAAAWALARAAARPAAGGRDHHRTPRPPSTVDSGSGQGVGRVTAAGILVGRHRCSSRARTSPSSVLTRQRVVVPPASMPMTRSPRCRQPCTPLTYTGECRKVSHMKTPVAVQARGLMPSLSPAEQRVAHVVINAGAGASRFTITELAERAGTSETTVIRFCRAMGFGGYPELRLTLAAEAGRAGRAPSRGTAEMGSDISPRRLARRGGQEDRVRRRPGGRGHRGPARRRRARAGGRPGGQGARGSTSTGSAPAPSSPRTSSRSCTASAGSRSPGPTCTSR